MIENLVKFEEQAEQKDGVVVVIQIRANAQAGDKIWNSQS